MSATALDPQRTPASGPAASIPDATGLPASGRPSSAAGASAAEHEAVAVAGNLAAARARLGAIGRRLALARVVARAIDGAAAACVVWLAAFALAHAVPAWAGLVVPAAVVAAAGALAWAAAAARAPAPLIAAWRSDRALGLPQLLLAALDPGTGPFAAAVARDAAQRLAAAPVARIAPIAVGRRAPRAAAAVLACACAVVALGLPVAPPVSAGREAETVAAALLREAERELGGPASEARRQLEHAAKSVETGEPRSDQRSLVASAQARLEDQRDRARDAAQAANQLAADPRLEQVRQAVRRNDAAATRDAIQALERELSGAGAGNTARASAAAALESAARVAVDETLARPLLRLAAMASAGKTEAAALENVLREIEARAAREVDSALALAHVARAARALGMGEPDAVRAPEPRPAAPGPAGGTGGTDARAIPPPGAEPSEFVPPPTGAAPARAAPRDGARVAFADESLVDAYLESWSRK